MIQQLLSEREDALGKKQESYDRRQNGLKKRWDAYRQKKQEAETETQESPNGDVVVPSAERLRNIRHEEIQTETLPEVLPSHLPATQIGGDVILIDTAVTPAMSM
jgi:hypothetical protein